MSQIINIYISIL